MTVEVSPWRDPHPQERREKMAVLWSEGESLLVEKGAMTGGGVTVSPDGRWILYVQFEITADLMLVENFR